MDNSVKKTFESVNVKSGNIFYLRSKEPKKGFVKNVSAKDEVTYHKDLETISGKLMLIEKRASDYGEKLNIYLEQEDFIYIWGIYLYNNGALSNWAQAVAYSLGGLSKGDNVEISLNKTQANDKGYLYQNAYFNVDGEKVPWTFEYSDMPKGVQKLNQLTKKSTWDFEQRDLFLLNKIDEAIASVKKSSKKAHTPDYNVTRGVLDTPKKVEHTITDPLNDLPF